jgi:hypothetical protein
MGNSGVIQRNNLLAALPQQERERLVPHLKLVQMPLGMVLYEPGDVLRHVYFPTDCIVSLLYVMKDGASAEISVVGNDGVVGVALLLGGETTPSRAVVQSAGSAYRLRSKRLKDEFYRHGKAQLLLLATPRRCLPRWPRRRYATDTIRSSSSSAAGYYCLWTGCHRTT